jgi:hypothetical protein
MYITSRLALVPTQSHIQWVVGVKQLGCEADHSLTYIADIKKKKKSYTSSLYMPSWHAWGSSIFSQKSTIKMDIQGTERDGVSWIHLGFTGTNTVCLCAHNDDGLWLIA